MLLTAIFGDDHVYQDLICFWARERERKKKRQPTRKIKNDKRKAKSMAASQDLKAPLFTVAGPLSLYPLLTCVWYFPPGSSQRLSTRCTSPELAVGTDATITNPSRRPGIARDAVDRLVPLMLSDLFSAPSLKLPGFKQATLMR